MIFKKPPVQPIVMTIHLPLRNLKGLIFNNKLRPISENAIDRFKQERQDEFKKKRVVPFSPLDHTASRADIPKPTSNIPVFFLITPALSIASFTCDAYQ